MPYLDQYLKERDKLSELRWDLFYIKGVLQFSKSATPEVTLRAVTDRVEEAFKKLDA